MSSPQFALSFVIIAVAWFSFPCRAQQPARAATQAHAACTVNLALVGQMRDILSNALVRGFKVPARDAAAFLNNAQNMRLTAPELLKAAAAQFKLTEQGLTAKVEKYRHCNCSHPVDSAIHPRLRVDQQPHPQCTINLELAGAMSDVVSNALVLGLQIAEPDVIAFLNHADEEFEDGPALFAAAAGRFKMSEDVLAAQASIFRHCNCTHPGGGAHRADAPRVDDGAPTPAFARDVTLHVVLHELGHALIREFDLPVLGNEETAADAFATYYLTNCMPDRAVDVLVARTESLMIEAAESPGSDWRGEHDDDARRAYQIAALALAADSQKYRTVGAIVGMSEQEINKARDYGAEIRRSWRRVLAPLWMPAGAASTEARVKCDNNSPFLVRLCESGLASEIETALRRFDWHSQVTVSFVDGAGRAGWNRSARTVTVHSDYIRRFITQAATAQATRRPPPNRK